MPVGLPTSSAWLRVQIPNWAEEFARKDRVVVVGDVEEALLHLKSVDDLEARLRSDGYAIREATAEPPDFVQRRMRHRRDRAQTQLPF